MAEIVKNTKYVHRVNRFHNGGLVILFIEVPYTRVWTLQAFDENNNMICEVNQNENNNFIKYVKFLKKVRESDYELTVQQINDIRSHPFFMESVISLITADHIFEVAAICNYSQDFVRSIRNKSLEEKNKFAYDLGFFSYEIDNVINKLGNL